jgi:hypothetical protein
LGVVDDHEHRRRPGQQPEDGRAEQQRRRRRAALLDRERAAQRVRWGAGSPSLSSSTGWSSWCRPANGTSASARAPVARSTRIPAARAAVSSSSAVLPSPGAPRSTSAPLRPARAAASSSPSVARSASRRCNVRVASPAMTVMRPILPY